MCVCVCVVYWNGGTGVALIIQHAKRMRHIILSSVACLLPPHFPRYLINGMIFEKKVSEYKMCFDFLYNFYPKHFTF